MIWTWTVRIKRDAHLRQHRDMQTGRIYRPSPYSVLPFTFLEKSSQPSGLLCNVDQSEAIHLGIRTSLARQQRSWGHCLHRPAGSQRNGLRREIVLQECILILLKIDIHSQFIHGTDRDDLERGWSRFPMSLREVAVSASLSQDRFARCGGVYDEPCGTGRAARGVGGLRKSGGSERCRRNSDHVFEETRLEVFPSIRSRRGGQEDIGRLHSGRGKHDRTGDRCVSRGTAMDELFNSLICDHQRTRVVQIRILARWERGGLCGVILLKFFEVVECDPTLCIRRLRAKWNLVGG